MNFDIWGDFQIWISVPLACKNFDFILNAIKPYNEKTPA